MGALLFATDHIFILSMFTDVKSDGALRSLAAMCKTELNVGFGRQSFCTPNRSKSNLAAWSEFRGDLWDRRLRSGAQRALLHTWHFTLQTVLVNQWPDVCVCCSALICKDSAFPTCTTTWGFKQALKQNLVLWENHVQVNISSRVQEKRTLVPEKVALCFTNHLKEVLNRRETSVRGRLVESRPSRRIICSETLIRIASVYCHLIFLVNIHCKTLTIFNIIQAAQPGFGRIVEMLSVVCFSRTKTPGCRLHVLSLHYTCIKSLCRITGQQKTLWTDTFHATVQRWETTLNYMLWVSWKTDLNPVWKSAGKNRVDCNWIQPQPTYSKNLI